MLQRQQELANVEAQLEREKQRKRELEAMQVPLMQMDDVTYEQLEQLRNSLMVFKHGAEAKLNGGAFLQANGGGGVAPALVNAAERMIMVHSEAATAQRNKELVGLETRVEQAKQRRRELDGMVPPLQMENLSYEQLEQLRNSVLMYKHGVGAKFGGGAASSVGPEYGYTVQYPAMGAYNYEDPSAVVPYDPATGNYHHHHPGY
ncbi:hypothetical protein SASPL_132097 [Salvia splendens]|uniref:Uncharacterized protein n=1 Tax=Salvia splendens TaxID=180675 RepID=A0A8X8XCD5_SALSN|nr:hypothetical protein SASPL_132097 [Salvia splendens]